MDTSSLSFMGPVHKWDGLTRGRPYEDGRAVMQQVHATQRTKALGGDSSKQYYIADCINLAISMISPDSTGVLVATAFKYEASYYFNQAKLNRFIPYSEAIILGTKLIGPHVPAAVQAADAERAFLARLERAYRPVEAAASAAGLIAPVPAVVAAAEVLSASTAAALQALGEAPVRGDDESDAQFSGRTQSYTAARVAAQRDASAAARELQRLRTKADVAFFPTVNGDDVSPSDALYMIFWLIMDIIFGLGDQDRLQQFYQKGTPGSQGSDSLQVYGQRIIREFKEISHMGGAAAARPDQTFINGLNDPGLRERLSKYSAEFLAAEQDPAVRLRRVIDHAHTLQLDQLSNMQWQLQYSAYTGKPMGGFGSSLSRGGRGSESSKGQQQHWVEDDKGRVIEWQGEIIPFASKIRVGMKQRWSQEEQDRVIKETRSVSMQTKMAKGLVLASKDRNNPDAVCKKCSLDNRHFNRNWPLQRDKQQQLQQQQGQGGAKVAMAGQLGAQDQASSSTSAQLEPIHNVLQQLSQEVNSLKMFAAVAAGQQQSQQQHGAIKPSKWQQQQAAQQQNNQSSGMCPTCDFAKAHDCWYANPALAYEGWRPVSVAPVKAIVTFLHRCQEMGKNPDLIKVQRQVREASKQGKLSPAVQQMPAVQRILQGKVAAAGGWAPQQPMLAPMPWPGYWYPGITGPPVGHGTVSEAAVPTAPPFGAPSVPATPHAAAAQMHQMPTVSNPWAAGPSSAAATAAQGTDRPASAAQSNYSVPSMFSYANPFAMLAMLPPEQLIAQQQCAAAAVVPESFSVSDVVRAAASDSQLHAMAVTRRQAGHPVSFVPISKPSAADPNTRLGGRVSPHDMPSTASSVSHRLLSAAAQMFTTAAVMLSPAAAQPLQQATKTLQKALQLGSKEEQAKATAEYMQQLSTVVAVLHQPALMMIMQQQLDSSSAAAGHYSSAAAAAEMPVAAAAVTAPADMESIRLKQLSSMMAPPKLLFKPGYIDYLEHLDSTEVLNRLSSPDPEKGLYVQFEKGQMHGISLAVNDDGSNILLISEKQCQRMGISILKDSSPLLKGIDGEMRQYIIGRTPPATLILGRGCAYPLTVEVPCLWVVAGNAGGMYDVLISKDIFKRWFAHVNPAYRHLVWYPLAAEHDFSVLDGVPVRGSISKHAVLAALQQQLTAPVGPVAAVAQLGSQRSANSSTSTTVAVVAAAADALRGEQPLGIPVAASAAADSRVQGSGWGSVCSQAEPARV